MATSDLTLSIITVIIFMCLYLFNIIVVSMQRIKDNWPVYRCQPTIMPFASLFGHNTARNFAYCIQNIQTGFMDSLLKPLNFNIGSLASIAGGLTDDLNFTRGFMDLFRFNLADIFKNIFGVVFNVMVEIQRTVINIKDMIGKLAGIMMTMMYVLNGSMLTMTSMWAGPPGGLVRALCFHPETKVKLKNGEMYPMKDIPLNSTLPNGSRVCAVMQISNLDANGDFVEKMFKVKRYANTNNANTNNANTNNANDDEDIIVSGSHLVYDVKSNQFVHVSELSEATIADMNCEVLYCLITSDHTIQLGEWIFHDWEDSNGSESKSFGK